MPGFVRHRLFLAFRPPAPLISEIGRIRDAFPSRGRVADDHLHMTLLPFPLFSEFPEPVADRLVRVFAAARLPRCRIIVDRLVLGLRSALLQPSEPVLGLQSFQSELARLVREAGLRPLERHRFSPHLTLFYNGLDGPCFWIDPISWTAGELVLVHSLHGEGRHETLARWALSDPQPRSSAAASQWASAHAG